MIDGSSTVKDLPTLMELLYSYFTALTPDQATFDVARENYEQRLKNAMQNPQMIFSMRAGDIRYGGNKLMTSVTPEEVASASYPEMLEMIHSLTGNAADFTFVFTGNIDEAVFLPLVEQYIATLPSKKKKTEVKKVSPVAVVEGQIADEFKQPMQVPATIVFDLYHGHNLEMNVKNDVLIEMLGDILDNIYIATLREEEGGTYGASVSGALNYPEKSWNLAYSFQTNAEQQASLIKRAQTELEKLLNEGADQANFTKVKEAMLKQEEINSRKNSYWNSGLVDYLRGFDVISSYRSAIESTTLEEFNNFAKNLYDGKNRIEIVMEGVAVEK
ncbi:MAG: insulinase family protein [Muribaculaceae bacterium]|nr:insulinase family protein [Muribaculaceae bacterium]